MKEIKKVKSQQFSSNFTNKPLRWSPLLLRIPPLLKGPAGELEVVDSFKLVSTFLLAPSFGTEHPSTISVSALSANFGVEVILGDSDTTEGPPDTTELWLVLEGHSPYLCTLIAIWLQD